MFTRRLLAQMAVAALILFSVGAVFHVTIGALLPELQRHFENDALYRPWDGWTSTYMIIHPFAYGPVFALVHAFYSEENGGWRAGLKFGLVVFVVGALPVWLLSFASFQISLEMALAFLLQSLCQYAAAGTAIGAIAETGANSVLAPIVGEKNSHKPRS